MTRDDEHTPSPQSVVVPVAVLNEAAGVLDCEGYGPLSMSLLSCLSAPAPSSLAGGKVEKLRALLERHQEERRMVRMKDTGAVYDTTLDLDTKLALAALPPEAPAREARSDLVRRIKYQVECSSGNLIKSGADSDMVRICLSHFNDLADEVAALTPRHEAPASEWERLTAEQAWADLLEKADRNSPVDSPMLLITWEEMADYMNRAQSQSGPIHADAKERAIDGLNKALAVVEPEHPVAAHFVRNAIAFIEGRAT